MKGDKMKKWIFVLIILLIPKLAQSDVTGKILDAQINGKKQIEFKVQYFKDGVEIPSPYPKFSGKSWYPSKHRFEHFAGLTKVQAILKLKGYIKRKCDNFTIKFFEETENQNDLLTKFDSIIGQSVTTTHAKKLIDIDNDGIPDEEWTIKTDGSKIIAPYVVP